MTSLSTKTQMMRFLAEKSRAQISRRIRRRGMALVAIACCVMVATTWILVQMDTARAQETPIQVETDLVRVSVVAVDSHGRALTDLNLDDFSVSDNGVPQKLSGFTRPSKGQIETSVSPGNLPGPSEEPAETRSIPNVLILLPGMGFTSRHYALQAVVKYLENANRNMRLAVADASGSVLPFTNQKARLFDFAESLRKLPAPPPGYETWSFRRSTEQLYQVMRQLPGRKAIVVYTDFGQAGSPSLWTTQPSQVLSKSLDVGAAIYPVDARGVVPVIPFGDAAAEGVPFDTSIQSFGLLHQSADLLQLASETGGTYIGGNDLGAVFRSIERDASSSYDLEYYQPKLAHDGAYHSISVTCKRRGVHIKARNGYFAPTSGVRSLDPNAQLRFVLNSDFHFDDIEIRFQPYFFPRTGPQGPVTSVGMLFRWDAGPENPTQDLPLSLVGTIRSSHGSTEDFSDQVYPVPTSEENSREGDVRTPLLDLPPGDYSMKVVVRSAAGDLGNSLLQLSIPEPLPHGTRLSSLVISDGTKSIHQTPLADNCPFIVGSTQVLPSLFRLFGSTDSLIFYARVVRQNASPISARLTVKDSSGKTVIDVVPEAAHPVNTPDRFGVPLLYRVEASKFGGRAGPLLATLSVKEQQSEEVQVETTFAVHAKQ